MPVYVLSQLTNNAFCALHILQCRALVFLRKGAGAPLCLMDYYILLMYTSIDVIPSHRSFPLFSETHLYASFAP